MGGSAKGDLPRGVCIRGVGQKPPIGYYEIRSTSGRYASYWNALLSFQILGTFLTKGNVNEFIRTETKVLAIAHFEEI